MRRRPGFVWCHITTRDIVFRRVVMDRSTNRIRKQPAELDILEQIHPGSTRVEFQFKGCRSPVQPISI